MMEILHRFRRLCGHLLVRALKWWPVTVPTLILSWVWFENRNLGTMELTLYDDRIAINRTVVDLLSEYGRVRPGTSRKHTIVLQDPNGKAPLTFENIAGRKNPYAIGLVLSGRYYSTIIKFTEDRLVRVSFNPQSDNLTVKEALTVVDDIRTWALSAGFDHQPVMEFNAPPIPLLQLRDEVFFDEQGEIHPDLLPRLKRAATEDDGRLRGFTALSMERGPHGIFVEVVYSALEYQPPARPFEDYSTRVNIDVVDSCSREVRDIEAFRQGKLDYRPTLTPAGEDPWTDYCRSLPANSLEKLMPPDGHP